MRINVLFYVTFCTYIRYIGIMEQLLIISIFVSLSVIGYLIATKDSKSKKLPVSEIYENWVNKNWNKLNSFEQEQLLLYSNITKPKGYKTILQYNMYIEYLYKKYNI